MQPFSKFPFVGDADRANYIAALMTPLIRPIIGGNVPLTVITSPIQGSGKTKLGKCVGVTASGARDRLMTAPDRGSDEEMRKRLTAKLRERPPVVVIDNVVGILSSPSLAAALTAGTWSDRELGASGMISVPVKAAFIVTGVNVDVTGDMSRRCVWVRLDPAMDKPWERVFDFDPEAHCLEHRNELVAAVFTLVRYWQAAGRPKWNDKTFGSFEGWAATVGGILATAGISGFLGNQFTTDSAAERERDALAAFYEGWRKIYGNEWKRSSEVAAVLSEAGKGTPEGKTIRETLLEEMLPIVDQPEGRVATKLTAVLRKYKDRVAGGVKLVSRSDPHDKIRRWAIVATDSNVGKP
jgi:hypothetical protein